MKRCSQDACFADDGEVCCLGTMDRAECPYWSTGGSLSEAPISPSPLSARVSWSGCALGLADLANLTPRGRTLLIGVLGAHDAGKTTLLTGNYLELLRGLQIADARFAGSRTLQAWESLAAWARFDDAARPPSFPPHTPRGTGRIPGLLHLALRGPRGDFRDLLLTDAPGEWFTRWAVQEDAVDADGARWIVRHADAFLVLADCERLAGPQRGPARNAIRQILERLGNHVHGRPTALVWSKADKPPSDTIRDHVRVALRQAIPHATEVECSIRQRQSLIYALEAALRPAWLPPPARSLLEPVLHAEPFSAFRGFHGHS